MPMGMSREVAMRVEQNETDTYVARMIGLQEEPGNPQGIAIRRFGHATALMAAGRPGDDWFNRVMGLTDADEDYLDAVAAWYRARDLSPRFDVVPFGASTSLLRRLTALGFACDEFFAVLYATPSADVPAATPGIAVDEISVDGLDAWVELYLDSFGFGEADRAAGRVAVRRQYAHPGFRHYVARLDGTPAAVGALYREHSVAGLAAAATIAAYRGRGCQMALVRRRIRDAALEGHDLIVAQVECGGVSARNLERAGLHLAYTKGFWRAR